MSNLRPSNAIASLFDAILADTPMLVRTRQLLPALDWRQVSPIQIDKMIEHITAADMKIPRWLAQELLCAGHLLSDGVLANDAAEFAGLSGLNNPDISAETLRGAAQDVLSPGFLDRLPDKLVEHLAVRFAELGATEPAAMLALRARSISPAVQRAIRPHVDAYVASLPEVRLRLCGSTNTHTLAATLVPSFASDGFSPVISEADYGALMSELIRPFAGMDALVVLLDNDHFMPQDWRKDTGYLHRDLKDRTKALADALRSYCKETATPLIVTTLPSIISPSAGYADRTHPTGAARACALVNQVLFEASEDTPLISVVDSDQAMSTIAPASRYDHKLWYYGRIAYSDSATRQLAGAIARSWRARTKGPAKVLALDFDNTIWGGIFGDDGIAKLQCGDDFPGSAFKAFQRECLRLKAQGMLLVGLSKNNEDALNVFDTHPGMLLNRDDFVATAVNWAPKPDNIQKIASDLRIGLDSVLFLDDSPHERTAMRRMCPDVIVPELPADPAQRPSWLRSLPHTWPLRVTEEDANRTAFYAAEVKARELRDSVASYDDYLAGLEQKLTIAPLTLQTLPRVAQLHLRTNQFNLTTERLGEAELGQFLDQADRLAVTGTVIDRFGDHGLVIAATVECDGPEASIRSFIMSCRVIGREVERAFLGALLDMLCSRGIREVTGLFKPTAKNAVSSRFYSESGFAYDETACGAERWRYSMTEGCTLPASRVVQISRSNLC
jgi:FkbH-like protein